MSLASLSQTVASASAAQLECARLCDAGAAASKAVLLMAPATVAILREMGEELAAARSIADADARSVRAPPPTPSSATRAARAIAAFAALRDEMDALFDRMRGVAVREDVGQRADARLIDFVDEPAVVALMEHTAARTAECARARSPQPSTLTLNPATADATRRSLC